MLRCDIIELNIAKWPFYSNKLLIYSMLDFLLSLNKREKTGTVGKKERKIKTTTNAHRRERKK